MNDTQKPLIVCGETKVPLLKTLGEGSFGEVVKVEWNGTPLACKQMKTEIPANGTYEGYEWAIIRECTFGNWFRQHPFAVHPTMICRGAEEGSIHLFMPCYSLDLEQWISTHFLRDRLQVFPVVASRMLMVLEYVHRHGVIHRDIKPSNILMSSDDLAFLADFGSTREISEQWIGENELSSNDEMDENEMPGDLQRTLSMVTPLYRPPEVSLSNTYVTSADIYSLGCVLIQLLCRSTPTIPRGWKKNNLNPHYVPSPVDWLRILQRWETRYPTRISELWQNLLRRMIDADPKTRPTASDLLQVLDLTRQIPCIPLQPCGMIDLEIQEDPMYNSLKTRVETWCKDLNVSAAVARRTLVTFARYQRKIGPHPPYSPQHIAVCIFVLVCRLMTLYPPEYDTTFKIDTSQQMPLIEAHVFETLEFYLDR